jgi:hypothetical protein
MGPDGYHCPGGTPPTFMITVVEQTAVYWIMLSSQYDGGHYNWVLTSCWQRPVSNTCSVRANC